MKKIKVYLNHPIKEGKRIIVNAELLSQTDNTVTVRLSDGNVIKRKKKRDIVEGEK